MLFRSSFTAGKVKEADKISGNYSYYTLDMRLKDKMVSCPLMTVEVRDGKIAQIHGDHNSDPTEEVKKFVDLWSRKVLPMALQAA